MNKRVKLRMNGYNTLSQSKLFRTMKSLLILCFITVQVTAANTTNQSVNVKLSLNNPTVADVVDKLHRQTGYEFSYDADILSLRLSKNVSVDVKKERIETVLSRIFDDSDVSFRVMNNRIFLKNNKKAETSVAPTTSTVQQQSGTKRITGVILDNKGEAIIGATIIEKGNTSNGTITDIDGRFVLNVAPDATIDISYVGYQNQEISTAGKTSFNIVLHEDTKTLDEVVVVGYGIQKKANLTGAVSQVKMEEVLGDRPVTNAFAALQGSIPGLMISGTSTPGQNNKSINIRGTLSINGGSPLVLIDNVPGDMNMLNPEDIESVSVLKDAASSAIYGARAANGVILITTKRPASNAKFQLNYNNNFGFESSLYSPQQTSLDTYFQAYQDAGFNNLYWANSQDVTKWRQYLTEYKADPSKFNIVGDGIYVDPSGTPYYLNEKDLFQNVLTTGYIQTHNISASGGTKTIRYRISGGMSSEDGPLITSKDNYNRLNVSSFVSADMTSWFTQELDLRYASSTKTMPQGRGNDIYTMRLINYYPEGTMPASINVSGGARDLPLFTPRNLVLEGNTDNLIYNNPRIFSKSILKPLPGLEAVFEYTFDKQDYNYKYYSDKWEHTTIQLGKSTAPANDVYTRRRYYTDYNAINAYATYAKSFGDHNLKAMVGYGQESSFREYIQNQVKDQVSSVIPSLGNATGEVTNDEYYTEYAIRSLFYRLNYNYKDKYLFEVNGRRDMSSKFLPNARTAFYPSFSAGWQVVKENFMAFSNKWLDEFKLRASWGQIGNQNISPYQFYPSMGVNNSDAVWLTGGNKVTTIGLPSLVGTFTWETVETLDFGLDFALLNYRLRGTFDWYQRDTKGMLSRDGVVELPAVVGASASLQNGADMRTKGWELGISWRDRIGKVGYNVGFSIYDSRSFITKYANESGLFYERNDAQNAKRYRVGMELGEIWGYVSDGYYTKDDFENTNTWKLKDGVTSIQGVNVRPGDMKFKNLMDTETSNNQIDGGDDTVSNPGDRKIIGNSTSRYQFGANFSVNYAGFDLSVMLQGIGKRDYRMGGQAIFPFAGSGASDAVFQPLYYNQTDYWKPKSLDPASADYMVPENPNAKYFRIYDQMQNVGSNTRTSDKYLQNAAYLRVKNVTLSYVFPKTWVQNLSMDQLKLFVGVENLATFSTLPKGIDPENMGWIYPFYRTVSFGANITF